MSLRPVQLGLDAVDERRLGDFWAAVLGWESTAEDEVVLNLTPHGFDWPDTRVMTVDVARMEAPSPPRHRVHLDLATRSAEHQADLVARCLALGATRADVGQGEVPWEVLTDPEGNVFCVLEPRPEYLDCGPIAAVIIECADIALERAFWEGAIDFELHDDEADFVSFRAPGGVGPYFELLEVPEPGRFPTRFHVDLLPLEGSRRDEQVSRLLCLGATEVDLGQGDASWRVLADPEGQQFCVLRER